jgi:hypothetical protein
MGHSAFAFPEMRPTKFHVLDALGAVFERGGGSPDAVGIGGTGEAERPGKLSGIEKVRRIALIKHLVRFRDERIEPSCNPEHGLAQNAIPGRNAKFLCRQGDKFFPGERIRRGGDMPGLVPGICLFGEL